MICKGCGAPILYTASDELCDFCWTLKTSKEVLEPELVLVSTLPCECHNVAPTERCESCEMNLYPLSWRTIKVLAGLPYRPPRHIPSQEEWLKIPSGPRW